MKYLKYFESLSNNDISEVKQKLDYLTQNLLDDYNGEFVNCGYRGLTPSVDHNKNVVVLYTIDLDLDLITSNEYKDNVSKINTELGNEDLSEILPHSRYDVGSNRSFFDKGAYITSTFTEYLDESYKDENIYQSAVFKPEFLKEMMRMQKGVKREFEGTTNMYGQIISKYNYDISLHDYSSESRGGIARINITIQK